MGHIHMCHEFRLLPKKVSLDQIISNLPTVTHLYVRIAFTANNTNVLYLLPIFT